MLPSRQLVRSSASCRCRQVLQRPAGTQMSLGVKSQSSSVSLRDRKSQLALSPGSAGSCTLSGKGEK